MGSPYSELLLAIAAAALSWSLVGIFTHVMTNSRRLEVPNDRSMHKVPVPVGAGIAMVATMLVLWPWWQSQTGEAHHLPLLIGFAGLGVLSWVDDRRQLSAAVRLGAQAVAVALSLASLPPEARLLEFLPIALERLLLGLAWLWFINLFNFMDGIDGLAGSETIAITIGYLAVLTYAALGDPFWRLALVIAASAAGYLFWNWHPAKVFMGDSGSIPLGFLLGWLMLDLALAGQWAAGLILPLYFVADATFTLLARARRGERLWQAHRQHFYQRAVLGGATPSGVVWRVCVANATLIALAVVSVRYPALALVAAAATVAALLVHLNGLARRHAS
jgi:UDP-N-acetylmuramyl pentapeptide phosphotransferase/UDP-N-acetylglucosamine-1-phosphate transferase